MTRRLLLPSALLFFVATIVPGAGPIPNWPAPATWTPPMPARLRLLAIDSDISGPLPFIPITPCRQYDSRNSTPLPDNVSRTVDLSGVPCGIPSTAAAVSVNITVFNITGALGNAVFRVGIVSPPPTAWINFPPTETQRANAGVVSTNGSGQIVAQVNMGGGQVDFIVDVNGYYASAAANQENSFKVINSGGPTVPAIWGETNSLGVNATGVYGRAASTTGATNGVWGENFSASDSSDGVFGVSEATSGQTVGVWGRTRSMTGNAKGVYGEALADTGATYGMFGLTLSAQDDAAGVKGIVPLGLPALPSFLSAGVRGEAFFRGVLGIGIGQGVVGANIDGTGTVLALGYLGFRSGPVPFGVYSAIGTIGCNGCTKQFVDPHPTDPSKTIHYVSLEGNEAGTYFRGTARTLHGEAVISVPEDFRMVTDEEGMTVQLTPVGAPATMYVVSEDLNRIVVRSSKDVIFHYLVQGIRPAWKNFQPIQEGTTYLPERADGSMPAAWPEWTRQRLIANGTYREDGKVNMETARRLGWTDAWAEREAEMRRLSHETQSAADAKSK